jgi:hypothetical protein
MRHSQSRPELERHSVKKKRDMAVSVGFWYATGVWVAEQCRQCEQLSRTAPQVRKEKELFGKYIHAVGNTALGQGGWQQGRSVPA